MDKSWVVKVVVLGLVCAPATAGQIYRWVDEAGQMHYGDRPVDDRAREVTVTPPPPVDQPGQERRLEAQRKLLKVLDEERQQQREAEAKAEQRREKRERRCRRAKAELVDYGRGGAMYELGEDGQRRFLSDAEIAQRIASWKEEAERWCD